MSDEVETIINNPKSWVAWKREAERLQKIIDDVANREAQPVAVTDEMALAFHRALNDGGIGESDLEEIKVGLRGALCNITAPPAPAYPERLPCPVHLLPGLKFGKGVPTRSMLDALVRREEYESEREAMTPEQKAEYDARIEAFKELLPRPPAPAVPDDVQHLKNVQELYHGQEERLFALAQRIKGASFDKYSHTTAQAIDVLEREIFGDDDNACRAAMLAQPVSGGYKLNSPEIPDGWIACSERMPADTQTVLCSNLLTELSGIPFIADYVGAFQLYDGTKYESGFYINRERQTVTHWMPLPAAPDGGNDNDTRR